MLNYMKSELYRTLRNRSLWIATSVAATLMFAVIFILNHFASDPTFPYSDTRFALGNIYMQMMLVLLFAVIFVLYMNDNEEKQHTIKHSVAFGFKRSTIYMGRFVTQILVSSIVYIVLVSLYTLLAYGLLQHSNEGELELLLRVSFGSMTCLFAVIAVTDYFLINYDNQSVATVSSVFILVGLPIIFNSLGRKIGVFEVLSEILPYNLMASYGPLFSTEMDKTTALLQCLGIGTIWMVLFLVLGVMKFNRKEIV